MMNINFELQIKIQNGYFRLQDDHFLYDKDKL